MKWQAETRLQQLAGALPPGSATAGPRSGERLLCGLCFTQLGRLHLLSACAATQLWRTALP